MTDEEFEEWKDAVEQLSFYKAKEMSLRKKLSKDIKLNFNVKSSGTQHFDYKGEMIKYVARETLKLDEDTFTDSYDVLSDEEKKCVDYKPVLNKRAYEKLPDGNFLMLNCVTRSEGTPSISIEEK